MLDAVGDVQRIVHAAQVLDEQADLFVIVCAAQLHLVRDDAVALFGFGVLGVEGNDLGQVHGVGSAVDDVCAVVCKGSAGLVCHGVHNAQQRVENAIPARHWALCMESRLDISPL